ncbi:serine/threonine-protein kinase [Candidatus Uabimicrobium sp. HlEnr_7]|uniref:serine/threonine-protein kinase n=1 Tax=Candidatus Uabimicrobium helgolandensis TaxID=3095367 RepID=UPI0035568C2C
MLKYNQQQLIEIFIQVAYAVNFANNEGVIHRDLKPANIMVDKNNIAKVMDFGLAKTGAVQESISQTGGQMGTPLYMAPEQVEGSKIGKYTDVYALGIILFEILTGDVPFGGDTHYNIFFQILNTSPEFPKNLKINNNLKLICFKALAKNPKDRYKNAEELVVDIEKVIKNQPINIKKTSNNRKTILGSTIILLSILVYLWLQPHIAPGPNKLNFLQEGEKNTKISSGRQIVFHILDRNLNKVVTAYKIIYQANNKMLRFKDRLPVGKIKIMVQFPKYKTVRKTINVTPGKEPMVVEIRLSYPDIATKGKLKQKNGNLPVDISMKLPKEPKINQKNIYNLDLKSTDGSSLENVTLHVKLPFNVKYKDYKYPRDLKYQISELREKITYQFEVAHLCSGDGSFDITLTDRNGRQKITSFPFKIEQKELPYYRVTAEQNDYQVDMQSATSAVIIKKGNEFICRTSIHNESDQVKLVTTKIYTSYNINCPERDEKRRTFEWTNTIRPGLKSNYFIPLNGLSIGKGKVTVKGLIDGKEIFVADHKITVE